MKSYLALHRSCRDIPQADGGVIRTTDQVTLHEWTPGKSIALSLVTNQPQVRSAVGVLWLAGMFAVVKDIHLCTDGLCGNHEGVLRHVASSVDFALMIDLLDDMNLACWHKPCVRQLDEGSCFLSTMQKGKLYTDTFLNASLCNAACAQHSCCIGSSCHMTEAMCLVRAFSVKQSHDQAIAPGEAP